MAGTVNKAKLERRAREARPRFEQVLTAENETFLWRIDDYPWARSVWNFHPEFEIHLIRKSTGTVFIGDYIGEFSPGHLTHDRRGRPSPQLGLSHSRGGDCQLPGPRRSVRSREAEKSEHSIASGGVSDGSRGRSEWRPFFSIEFNDLQVANEVIVFWG